MQVERDGETEMRRRRRESAEETRELIGRVKKHREQGRANEADAGQEWKES